MKVFRITISNGFGICFILIHSFLLVGLNAHSQYHAVSGGGTSLLFKTPNGKISLIAPAISTEALFKVEVKPTFGSSLGSIQNLILIGDRTFGIYQTGPTISNGYFGNYFENRVNIGQSDFLDMLGVQGDIGLRPSPNSDTIRFNVYGATGCYPTIAYRFHDFQVTGMPLVINNCSVKAPILETVSLKITNNPGENLVLISDLEGNASWADPSRFHDDDWLSRSATGDAGEPMNLYLNEKKYTFVGIGTEYPKSKLHVVDGNIMISRSALSAPGSANGSLLFGEIIDPQSPLGEWGIEYFHEGLNFKKVPTTGDPGKNNCLFLKNNGNVGIATEQPLDKFQVNDGFSKVVLGAGPMGYLGFNIAHNEMGWIAAPGSSGVTNSYSLIYNSMGGDMYFSSANTTNVNGNDYQYTQSDIESNTKLVISQSGKIGIGTLSPEVSLDIRKNYNASIQCFTENSHPASIWVRNNLNGYGLGIDNQGTGHISQFGITQTPIMSFRSGKVGIGNFNLSDYATSNSKLFVEGGITTEEVRVKVIEDWADHVFSPDYKLRSLSELEQFIVTHKHLPDVPTSTEVEKDGIELGKMNALLLQKVEELTLYILQMEKKMSELESK